jgi:catechol 2,3-dioxygenase-like lactoylglutathione lyase family enzyme
MTLRPVSVAVAVTDRKEAARWYVKKLGLRLVDDDPEHWTTVGDRSRRFLLHLCEVGDHPGRKPPRSEVGNTGILFATNESMARTYARMRRRGVRFSLPPKRFPWGWVAKFLDPDGNEFWLNPGT